MLYFKLLTNGFPFISRDKTQEDLFENILSSKPQFPPFVDSADKFVIKCLLEKDSEDRISLKKLIELLRRMI